MPSVQPLQGYLASADPDLKAKTADIIDLYLHAPQHTAGVCVDEKTATSARALYRPLASNPYLRKHWDSLK